MSIRRYANPDQFTLKHKALETIPTGIGKDSDFSGVKIHAGLGLCCDDPKAKVCAYDVDVPNLSAITGITFKDAGGSNVTVTFSAPTGAVAVKKALASALISKGVDPYYDGDDYKGIIVSGSRIRFIGTVEIVSITQSTNPVSATKKCVPTQELIFSVTFALSANPGKVATSPTSAGTQVGTTGGWATGNAANVVTAFESALSTENIDITRPVSAKEESGSYIVTMYVNKDVYHSGTLLDRMATNQSWIA